MQANQNQCVEKSFQLNNGPVGDNCLSQLVTVHPLKASEQNFATIEHEMNMQILRNREGIHAPLKIAMERQAFRTVGRLPCLPSSNVHLDVLSGRDEQIDFSDFLGGAEFSEKLTNPHAMVAKHYKI